MPDSYCMYLDDSSTKRKIILKRRMKQSKNNDGNKTKKQVRLRYLSVRYIPASEYTIICIMNEPAVSTFELEDKRSWLTNTGVLQ